MYAALGLAEAGEVQNKVKKAFRDDGVIRFDSMIVKGAMVSYEPLTPERRAQIIKELGGALWYIAAVCDEINDRVVVFDDVALAGCRYSDVRLPRWQRAVKLVRTHV